MPILEIKDLHVCAGEHQILKGVDLRIADNEIHALLGPNGNGKSTLLHTIMGHPKYRITQGSITFAGQDISNMSTDARSRLGLFLAMQYPAEISGITNAEFMRSAISSHNEEAPPFFKFIQLMDKSLQDLGLKGEFAHRFINEGFSGGEKKRNEIAQMLILKPKLALLDEIDSGLDVDALKIVADAINKQIQETGAGLLIVSHYERFYQLVQPTFAHVMVDGQLVCSGDMELVTRIDVEGYDWLLQEMKLKLAQQPNKRLAYRLGICGIKERS